MAKSPKPRRPSSRKEPTRWADVKAALDQCDRKGLVGVLRDLYEASTENRLFLHGRFGAAAATREDYRRRVRDAVYPDLLTNKPIRLRDANTAIAAYKRSTGDLAGTVDLMLEFVEAGTELAVEVGYGDEAFFLSLERKLNEVVTSLDALPGPERSDAIDRLMALGTYENKIGWGYGDFLADVAATVQARRSR